MDNLKLYAKKEREIDSIINTVRIFSDDIGMKFGLNKCARLIVERGKVNSTEGLHLGIETIQGMTLETGYKSLGIMQTMDIMLTGVKEKAASH